MRNRGPKAVWVEGKSRIQEIFQRNYDIFEGLRNVVLLKPFPEGYPLNLLGVDKVLLERFYFRRKRSSSSLEGQTDCLGQFHPIEIELPGKNTFTDDK